MPGAKGGKDWKNSPGFSAISESRSHAGIVSALSTFHLRLTKRASPVPIAAEGARRPEIYRNVAETRVHTPSNSAGTHFSAGQRLQL
jgi:hypothetical protein